MYKKKSNLIASAEGLLYASRYGYTQSQAIVSSQCAPSIIKSVVSCDGKFKFVIEPIKNPESIKNISIYHDVICRNDDFLYRATDESPREFIIDFCQKVTLINDEGWCSRIGNPPLSDDENWKVHALSELLENRIVLELHTDNTWYIKMQFDKEIDFCMEKARGFGGRVEFIGVDLPDEIHNHTWERHQEQTVYLQ